MSLEPLKDGEIAAVVTYLELSRDRPREDGPPSLLRLERRERIVPDAYRALFRKVGSRWLWFSRLVMSDAALSAILHDPRVDLYAVRSSAENAGLVELDFRDPAACNIAFLGLVPGLTGQGHGRWLLAETLARAWRDGVERVTVHTCTLDHPAALPAYLNAGFVPRSRAVERFADPRLAGILPPGCAPQLPLLGTCVASTRCA